MHLFMSEQFIVTEDNFHQLGDSNLSLKEGTSKDSVYKQAEALKTEHFLYIHTHNRKKKYIQLTG